MGRKAAIDFHGLSIPGRTKPYVIAHRGNRAACPENTMAAFRRAINDGADMLETDLRLTSDGILVCIHDESVDRTTDGSGQVARLSLAEIKALSASCGREGFREERIPTLKEVSGLLPQDMWLVTELKTDQFLENETCMMLVSELERSGVRDRTLVISFSFPRLMAVQAVAPDVPTGWITLRSAWPRDDVRFLGPHWPLLLINPLYVFLAHYRGQSVCPLDPSPDPRLWLYRLLGCDAVLTDDPLKTCTALKRSRPAVNIG